ncbi:MAG: hypothetical protein LQ347_000920 [Umbilicaria vellea]|nr:MAG: hypothetical protein LQ347_000920 [Umbilicaria vellea]
MATDKSLATLLRALQSASDAQEVTRLFGSATTLLTLLSNPLNTTVLTSQLLSAPAIWYRPDGIRTSLRILSIFNTASIRILEQQGAAPFSGGYRAGRDISKEDWVKAVVKGADDRSPRWRHVLVLGGLLSGFESENREGLPTALRRTLEGAIVKAANLALEESGPNRGLDTSSLAMVLSYIFDLLSAVERAQIKYDLLLPVLCEACFFSKDGLHWGYFLGTMDADVVQSEGSRFNWSTRSSTYFQLQRISSGSLVASLGSLSRLTAFSIEMVRSVDLLAVFIDDLSAFTRSLCVQWRQNKLSEIDATDETAFLSEEALRTSLPLLWQVLKTTTFTIIICLRALLGRVLGDRSMSADLAPFMAIQTLHILRNLYFVSSRLGQNASSQYIFVYFTAIDILHNYPLPAEAFLREIRPAELGRIPAHPLDRCHDLYFLNVAEHFTLVLSPQTNEDLLIAATMPYLSAGNDPRLLEIFEAAHSVMLAVLATPQNTDLSAKHIPFYIEALFKVFPQSLSPRQFRMAVKTLVRITTPPFPISEAQPMLSSAILELVHHRARTAVIKPLPPVAKSPIEQIAADAAPALSEQAVLILTMIDALPYLPIDELEEWLPLTASAVNIVTDPEMLPICRQRFWEAMSSGEMDVERAERRQHRRLRYLEDIAQRVETWGSSDAYLSKHPKARREERAEAEDLWSM